MKDESAEAEEPEGLPDAESLGRPSLRLGSFFFAILGGRGGFERAEQAH